MREREQDTQVESEHKIREGESVEECLHGCVVQPGGIRLHPARKMNVNIEEIN